MVRAQRAHTNDGGTIRAQVDAVRVGGERDIRTDIDRGAVSGPVGARANPPRQVTERSAVEIALAELDDVNTCFDSFAEERPRGRRSRLASCERRV